MAYKKDPNATLDFTVDWSEWLTAVGDAIASVEWFTTGGVVVESSEFTVNSATAFVSGGVVGEPAKLTCRITTSNVPPRIDDRTLSIKIVQR